MWGPAPATPILCVSSYAVGMRTEVREAEFDAMYTETDFMLDHAETIRKYIDHD